MSVPRNYEKLLDYAMSILEEVDFLDSPQLCVAWRKKFEIFAAMVAEDAINLPWEDWADEPEE